VDITPHYTTFKSPGPLLDEHFIVSGPSPERTWPIFAGGGEIGDVNLKAKDPCGRGSCPPSSARGGADSTTMSNPWHLLHAMRAMRINSQDPPVESTENGEDHHGGDLPGKEQDNSFGVSRHLDISFLMFCL